MAAWDQLDTSKMTATKHKRTIVDELEEDIAKAVSGSDAVGSAISASRVLKANAATGEVDSFVFQFILKDGRKVLLRAAIS
jgi:hypothetical protein